MASTTPSSSSSRSTRNPLGALAELGRLLGLLALPLLLRLAIDYPKTDRWQRPLILDPESGKHVARTRVTTVAKALDDMNGLIDWHGVMVAGGAALRPDILAKISARWPRTDENKGELNRLAKELKEAGGGSVGANLGDALHTVLARRLMGEKFTPLPPLDADLKAVEDLLERAGLEPVPGYVERTVCVEGLSEKVAGSFDSLLRRKARPELGKGPGRPIITDLKTGKDLDLSWPTIAAQLALYSRASTVYTWETETHEPMPDVRQDQGLVIHAPAGTATAELYVVDLERGWQAVQVALWVRAWRKARDFVRPAAI